MKFALLVVLVFSTAFGLASATPLPDAVQESDLDIAACRIIRGVEEEPVDATELRAILGLGKTPAEAPVRVRKHAPKAEDIAQYLLVFKQPAAVGTVLGGTGELRIHKPGARLPADPTNPSDWTTVEVQSSQTSPRFAPLPLGTKTRAILISAVVPRTGSPYLRLLAPRVMNHTPTATANAEAEYTTEPTLSAPYTFDAGHITRGNREWINSGKNGKGLNTHAPITDVAPSWFILSWAEKRRVEGVMLQDNFAQFELQAFDGQPGINPVAATDQEWKTIRKPRQTLEDNKRWLTFEPMETRALRLRITGTTEGAVARLAGFHVFTDLGDKPAPIVVRAVQKEAPVKIPYTIEQAGQVTFAIDGPDGVRVRNVMANVEQAAGANAVVWDLKDDKGAFVPPGKYHWKGITHPPLELRYEMTAYPNVTSYFPERPAWLTGVDGSGGWLADHTPPHAACTAGDRVFLGAPVAESGVSLVECDLEGRKLWGHHSFAGFTGCFMLASDGKTVFNTMNAANSAGPGLDKNSEMIWAVDLETRAVRTVATLQPTAERKRGIQGFAAHDNKVYMAIHSPGGWLDNAAAATDVDSQNSLPTYTVARLPRFAHEEVPDPRNDFIRLFRLKDMPPGEDLSWLESTKNPDREQHIMLAFTKPVSIGSLVFPPPPRDDKVQFQISVLKPDAPYPPRLQEKGDWQVIPLTDKSAWAVVPLPAGTLTRALRLTFIRGGAGAADDLLAGVEEKKDAPSLDKLAGPEGKKSGFPSTDANLWQRQIEGMKLLGRRFENLFATATVRVNSGKALPDGTWDAARTEPISEAEPAIYEMEWKQEQTVRGLAIREIDGAVTEVDVFNGQADAPVDLEGSAGWENVATYNQQLHSYAMGTANQKARYLDGYVDFGREVSTRAIRLRVVKQWDTKEHNPSGVREDLGGQALDPKRCHVYGIAPLKYLGGEAAVDPLVTERLEVLDATTGKIVQEVHLAKVGTPAGKRAGGNVLAVNSHGDIFAISDKKLVRVDVAGGKHQVLASDLTKPTALALDAAGNFYIFDGAPDRKNIRVYGPSGQFTRAIGAPGGYQRGAWDPNRMDDISAITLDPRGQVWAVDTGYWPKRVSLWSNEGKFLKEFLGPTQYGGAGCLDPGDKRRLFYGPLEFELDWKTGKTRLKNLTSLDGRETSDVPRRVNDRLYLVNTHPENNPLYGLVYLHEGDHVRLVAAVGVAGSCKVLQNPALLKAIGGKSLLDYQCVWSDLNGDEQAQANELQLWPLPQGRHQSVTFDNQLGAQIGTVGFRVKQWLPNGVPVYERFESPGLWPGMNLHLDDGNYYHFETEYKAPALAAALRPDGKPLWTYTTEGASGFALPNASPMHPGQMVCDIGFAGHATAHAGDLGEFLVFNTNIGIFNIMTSDGLFAGQFFREVRDPLARPWSGTNNERGLRLDDITPGQEHFNGYFCRTSDNHYYAVVGHNHASVVEVVGMDRFRRFSGEIEVTGKMLAETQAWDRAREVLQVYARAPVVDCYRLAKPPKIDGGLSDWPFISAELDENAKFRIGYDDSYLYVAYQISGRGPLKNQGQQWDRLFKTGASVDLQISTDPTAPPDRRAPVAGDQRLLLTMMGDKPAAVLYQAVVPGTPAANTWQVVSPVGSASFDHVAQLEKPRVATSGNEGRYVLEAAIPLSALGLKITPGLRVKMDWGVLVSGPDGTEVLRREYWANKATQIIADAPSEAELHPELWGHIRFHAETADAHFDPTAKKADRTLDDVLNDLK